MSAVRGFSNAPVPEDWHHSEAVRLFRQEGLWAPPAILEECSPLDHWDMGDARYLLTTRGKFDMLLRQRPCIKLEFVLLVDVDAAQDEDAAAQCLERHLVERVGANEEAEVQNSYKSKEFPLSTRVEKIQLLRDTMLKKRFFNKNSLADFDHSDPSMFREARNLLSLDQIFLPSRACDPFLPHSRFQILRTMCTEVDKQQNRAKQGPKATLNIGKQITSLPTNDVRSCLGFHLLGEAGTFTNWHVDVLDGTWSSTLFGSKGWFILSQPRSSKDGRPPLGPGGAQLVLNPAGTTFIMMPGTAKPHAVVNFRNTWASGGMAFDEHRLYEAIEKQRWLWNDLDMTNEHLPRQYFRILDLWLEDAAIADNVKESIRALKDEQRHHLACCCKRRCTAQCPCAQPGRPDKSYGCTTWCHSDAFTCRHHIF